MNGIEKYGVVRRNGFTCILRLW